MKTHFWDVTKLQTGKHEFDMNLNCLTFPKTKGKHDCKWGWTCQTSWVLSHRVSRTIRSCLWFENVQLYLIQDIIFETEMFDSECWLVQVLMIQQSIMWFSFILNTRQWLLWYPPLELVSSLQFRDIPKMDFHFQNEISPRWGNIFTYGFLSINRTFKDTSDLNV